MTHDWRKLEAEIVYYLRHAGQGPETMPNTIFENLDRDYCFQGIVNLSGLAQALAQAGFIKPTVVSQKVEP